MAALPSVHIGGGRSHARLGVLAHLSVEAGLPRRRVRGQTSRDNDVRFTLAFASALGSGDVGGAIAAWAEGAAESDIIAVREAMTCTTRPMPDPPLGQVTSDQRSPSLEVGSAAEVSEAVSQPAGSAPETAGTRAEITPSDAEQSFGSEFGQ